MHAANEKAHMKCIDFPAMAPTIMAFNASNEWLHACTFHKLGLIKGDMLVMLRGLINSDGGSTNIA